jgi:hypothetical protein
MIMAMLAVLYLLLVFISTSSSRATDLRPKTYSCDISWASL